MPAAPRLIVLSAALALLAACDDGGSAPPASTPDAEMPPTNSGGRDAAAPLDASRPMPDAAPAMDAARPDAAVDAAQDAGLPDAQVDAGMMALTLPQLLSETGLYAAGSTDDLAPGVHPYEPRYVLWSDGADKQRWLFLPEGAQIDTSDMDAWRFPVGTKVWKEFSRDGKRLETRLFWKTGPTRWQKVAYLWNDDATEATAVKNGAQNVHGTTHDVPGEGACDSCHEGRPDFLLGVSAIQLAHGGSGTTLGSLAAAGLLTDPPDRDLAPPDDAEWDALGYLHANCGNCHNPQSLVWGRVELDLWLTAAEVGGAASATSSYQSNVGVAITESVVGSAITLRIAPGQPAQSMLIERMKTRGSELAMPPTASEQVDEDGVAAISAWIEDL